MLMNFFPVVTLNYTFFSTISTIIWINFDASHLHIQLSLSHLFSTNSSDDLKTIIKSFFDVGLKICEGSSIFLFQQRERIWSFWSKYLPLDLTYLVVQVFVTCRQAEDCILQYFFFQNINESLEGLVCFSFRHYKFKKSIQ